MSDNIIQEVGFYQLFKIIFSPTSAVILSKIQCRLPFIFYNKEALCFFSQYVDLQSCYSELLTLNNQYIKYIIEIQRRLEDEEVCTRSM